MDDTTTPQPADADELSRLSVSADSLGFQATALVPLDEPVGPPSKMVATLAPDLSPDEREKLFQSLIRQDALVSVQEISRDLAEVALEPTTPVRQRLDINEQLMKLAGLDKKVADTTHTGGERYQLVINLGTQAPETFKGVTIEQKPVVEETDAPV